MRLFWVKLESAVEANVILEKIGGRDLKYPLNKMFYDHIIRPILFRLDPEFTHNSTIKIGSLISKSSLACQMLRRMYDTQFPTLKVKVWGIEFENPVGLIVPARIAGKLFSGVFSKVKEKHYLPPPHVHKTRVVPHRNRAGESYNHAWPTAGPDAYLTLL